MASIPVKEIRIKISTGEIAAKWWRSTSVQPILFVHGWQDNAGSFDTLIPLLPSKFSYLAIDLVGHGLSTHLPPGHLYNTSDYVASIEEIRLFFKWPKISLIGHSMGAILCFLYSTTFPNNVNLVCALDTLKPQVYDGRVSARLFLYRMQKSFMVTQRNLNESEPPPEYTIDEFLDRIVEGSIRSIDRDKAKYLMERGSKPSLNDLNKFIVSRDIRVKYMHPLYMDQETCLELLKMIKIPYLFVRGTDRDFCEPQKRIQESVDLFRRTNSKFEFFKVNGTHHLHLNHPELIADKLSDFLNKNHSVNVNEFNGEYLRSKL